MKLQEGGCGVAGTSRDFAGVRSPDDAEQQADHHIAPEQPGELLGKFGRTACEHAGRLGARHDFAQGGAACLASRRVERTRHFRGLDRLGNPQSEYRTYPGTASRPTFWRRFDIDALAIALSLAIMVPYSTTMSVRGEVNFVQPFACSYV